MTSVDRAPLSVRDDRRLRRTAVWSTAVWSTALADLVPVALIGWAVNA